MIEEGFLNQSGKLYPCPHLFHIELAMELLEKISGINGFCYFDGLNCPDDVLIGKGWVKISKRDGLWKFYWEIQMTHEQVLVLEPYIYNKLDNDRADRETVLAWEEAIQ